MFTLTTNARQRVPGELSFVARSPCGPQRFVTIFTHDPDLFTVQVLVLLGCDPSHRTAGDVAAVAVDHLR